MLVATHDEDLRRKLQKVIQYPGKSRDLSRDDFDEAIVDAGGVRFFLKHEQCRQISIHNHKKLRRKFYPCATETNLSEKSKKKVLQAYLPQ